MNEAVEASGVHDLTGRVALVTGAGVGIGRAIALALGAAGAIVGVHYRASHREADDTLTQIRERGGDGVLLKADLTEEEQARHVVDRLVAETGQLDILINNAGSPVQRKPIEECSAALFRAILDVNLLSAFYVTQRAIPQLRRTDRGSIVNILTLSIQTGGPGGAGPYAVAKGGLQVLTRTLARELAPRVRVNAVMPGVIETRHHEVFTRPERMAEYRKETALGRNGQADEVARAVVFLASDAASFMTGALLDINGGRFLR